MQSDHSIITFQLTDSVLPQVQATSRYVFDFPKANYVGLSSFFMDTDFSQLLSSNDVNLIWSSLKNIIYSGMNIFIPKVRLKKNQFPCWFTPELDTSPSVPTH